MRMRQIKNRISDELLMDVILRKIHVISERNDEFILDKEVLIKECDSMVPLTCRTAGGVMSPLKDC